MHHVHPHRLIRLSHPRRAACARAPPVDCWSSLGFSTRAGRRGRWWPWRGACITRDQRWRLPRSGWASKRRKEESGWKCIRAIMSPISSLTHHSKAPKTIAAVTVSHTLVPLHLGKSSRYTASAIKPANQNNMVSASKARMAYLLAKRENMVGARAR